MLGQVSWLAALTLRLHLPSKGHPLASGQSRKARRLQLRGQPRHRPARADFTAFPFHPRHERPRNL